MLQTYTLVILFLIVHNPSQPFHMIPSFAKRTSIPIMSSLSSITDIAKRLVHSKVYVCIAVAGGGGHAISTLASTPGASALFLEGTIAYDRNSLHAYIGQTIPDGQKYVSYETATLLSRAAVRHALKYRANLHDYPHCVGIGVTSALVTTQDHSKSSFGFVVATRADGTEWKCSISLAGNQRSRVEEDIVMGKLALQALEQLETEGATKLQLDNPNDKLEEFFQPVVSKDEVYLAAERIQSGDVRAVLLLPTESKTFLAITDPVLPLQSLVFPGSFNPPHVGHTTLAQVASQVYRDNPPVVWELSLSNPDKMDMDPASVSERAHHFFTLADDLPDQWGILLTRAPLFKEKVEILRPYMATVHSGGPLLGFLIGADTMVRILNPKYYGDSKEDMLDAVREMGRSGVHFVVGGRLDQSNSFGESRFVTGVDEVADLPKDVQRMFTIVTEKDFRVDISSTEIRTKKQVTHQSKSSGER